MKTADYVILGGAALLGYVALQKYNQFSQTANQTQQAVSSILSGITQTANNASQVYDDATNLPPETAKYLFNTGVGLFDRDANALINAGLTANEAFNKTVADWTGAGLDIFGLFKSTGYVPNFTYTGSVPTNLTQSDGSANTYSMPIQPINAVENTVNTLFPNLVIVTSPTQITTPTDTVNTITNAVNSLFSGITTTTPDTFKSYFENQVSVQYNRQVATYGTANDWVNDAYAQTVLAGFTAPSGFSYTPTSYSF